VESGPPEGDLGSTGVQRHPQIFEAVSKEIGTIAMSQPMSPPPIHVRAVITWIAIFPLVTIGSFVIAPFANDWNPVLRAFMLSTLVVPLAVYFVVPQLTRAYAKLRPSWTSAVLNVKGKNN
jgi:antibiotic biosynthesis monooxygenase (ABM) superfamily enzyme